jgi:hypothetical protein
MAIDCAGVGAIPGLPASKLTPADVKPVAVPVKPSKLGTGFQVADQLQANEPGR